MDPEKGVIVIATGTGTEVKGVEYMVDKTTAYWVPSNSGRRARAPGLRAGTDVWYRVGRATA